MEDTCNRQWTQVTLSYFDWTVIQCELKMKNNKIKIASSDFVYCCLQFGLHNFYAFCYWQVITEMEGIIRYRLETLQSHKIDGKVIRITVHWIHKMLVHGVNFNVGPVSIYVPCRQLALCNMQNLNVSCFKLCRDNGTHCIPFTFHILKGVKLFWGTIYRSIPL